MKDMDSDIVELIIAVDLNPSDPEEPINVNNVDVRSKGEGESGEACHKCTRILDAISRIDPKMADAVDGLGVDEAISALERMADEAPEDAQEEADMFDKAMSMPMTEEKPKERGSFKTASYRAFGKKKDDEDEE